MRKWLFNILVLPLFYFISILPFWLLYLLSDFLYLVVYVLIGYRKKVVTQNLISAFPQKSEEEIATIRRQFYRHFCDVMLETLKLLTISKRNLIKRCSMDEAAQQNFKTYLNNNQSVVCVLGHCGNWEWTSLAFQLYFPNNLTGVYHPLSNKNVDSFMLNLRRRFGGEMVAMNLLYKRLLQLKDLKKITTVGLIADQSPPPEGAYWTRFLNQDTPVFYGPEKLAKKFNFPLIYLSSTKVKRGYYKLETAVLTETPQQTAEGEISELHTRQLEKNLLQQPFNWLWSHRRWKHKKTT